MNSPRVSKTITLTAATCLLPVLLVLGIERLEKPVPPPSAGNLLSSNELLHLENIARRTEAMMNHFNLVPTRVWPHAVTDAKGRQGLFISSLRPLFASTDERDVLAKRAWVVLGLIAAVKYAEGSQIGHIAFTDTDTDTDSDGFQEDRYYYDFDIAQARDIHRDLVSGRLALEEAFEIIASHWEKVTAEHDLAIR